VRGCQEREHLLPLAEEGFDLAAVHFPTVDGKGCVRVLTNFYLAPAPIGAEVQVKVHAASVEIWHQGKSIACHERQRESRRPNEKLSGSSSLGRRNRIPGVQTQLPAASPRLRKSRR
jgi:hypothetical protein